VTAIGEDTGAAATAYLPAHLYVHVPFCASKCDYCDFYSVPGAPSHVVATVFTGIRSQLALWESSGLEGVIDTVYFGGGTPSLVAPQVVETLAFIRDHFVLHPSAEVTIEGNPDSLDAATVASFLDAGVTRVSVGIQAFDDHVLRVLGRRHDAEAAWSAARRVVGAGMQLSVDLMCGVPGQTRASWAETLRRACETGAKHASVYPLSIEQNTPLDVAISAGLLPEPSSDEQAEMMIMAEKALGDCGLSRYEIANYSAGAEYASRHNTAYWTGSPYIGVGPGAHGMLDAATARLVGYVPGTSTAARVRYANASDIEAWLVGKNDATEELSHEEAAREDVMLGLRLTRGVSFAEVEAAGLAQVLDSLAADGLVTPHDGPGERRWRTTERGWLLGNEVFERVWTAGE